MCPNKEDTTNAKTNATNTTKHDKSIAKGSMPQRSDGYGTNNRLYPLWVSRMAQSMHRMNNKEKKQQTSTNKQQTKPTRSKGVLQRYQYVLPL